MRTWLLLILALLALFAAGCGGGDDATTATTVAGRSASTAVPRASHRGAPGRHCDSSVSAVSGVASPIQTSIASPLTPEINTWCVRAKP